MTTKALKYSISLYTRLPLVHGLSEHLETHFFTTNCRLNFMFLYGLGSERPSSPATETLLIEAGKLNVSFVLGRHEFRAMNRTMSRVTGEEWGPEL